MRYPTVRWLVIVLGFSLVVAPSGGQDQGSATTKLEVVFDAPSKLPVAGWPNILGEHWWARFSANSDILPSFATESARPKVILTWGKKGDQPGEFYSPIGIAINAKDEVFVTDLNNSRLQIFNSDGKHVGGFDLPRDEPKRKSCQASGILIDGDLIYLSFMQQHKVAVYQRDGKVVREWGKKGEGEGDFHQAGGMCWGPDGTLFVCDQCNHRIQKFTKDGKFLGKWGEHGGKPGQFGGVERKGSRFAGPHFVSIDSKGRLYTTEGCEARVQQLDLVGKPLASWGNKTQEPGGFGAAKFGYSPNPFGPIAVFVDRYDRVWVSSLNDRVQCFTPEGKYLFGIAGTGKEPGHFYRPHGMAMDSKGHLYVCDASNQRIQKFAVPTP